MSDEHRLGDLLVTCIPRLRRYARALTGERSAADDLVQDTLERAWRRLSQWRGGEMRPWLFSIMHNLHVDQMRRPKPVTAVAAPEDGDPPPSGVAPADTLEIRDIATALTRLPVEQREILLLVALEGMTYDEVAQTLGLPVGTVMSRLSRGREKLRLLMEGCVMAPALRVVK